MNYIGIDHHRQSLNITLLGENGAVLKSGRVANPCQELEDFLNGIKGVKAVVEAGRSSYTMVDILEDLGIEMTVAHSKEIKAIAKAEVKADKRDLRMIPPSVISHFLRENPRPCKPNRVKIHFLMWQVSLSLL